MRGEEYGVKAEDTTGMAIGDGAQVKQYFPGGNKTSTLALVVVLALVIIAVIALIIIFCIIYHPSRIPAVSLIPAEQATPTTSLHAATSFTAPPPTSTWTQTPTATQTIAATPTATPSQPIIAGFLVIDSYGFTSTIEARSIVTVTVDQIILLRPQLSTTPWPENVSCFWNARAQSRGRVSPTNSCTTSYQAPGNTGPDFIIVDILEGGEQIDWSYMHIQVQPP